MANLGLIKVFAAQKGITMTDVAGNLGITQQALYKIMREGSTKIETLERIASLLGVSAGAFFEDGGTPPPTDTQSESREFIEMLKERDRQAAKKDEQMDRLIAVIESLTAAKNG